MSNGTLRGIPRPRNPAKEVKATLTIDLLADGSVRVNGPIQNRALCYGMLESGKDAVRTYNERQAGNEPAIEVPLGDQVKELVKA